MQIILMNENAIATLNPQDYDTSDVRLRMGI